MLQPTDHERVSKTHRVVTIHWSNMGHVGRRKQRWGGKVHAWDFVKVHDALYIISNQTKISVIHEALMQVLAPSDRATFTYPYGTTTGDASAMSVRVYGKAAKELKHARKKG
jgi:hypothetical protein